MPEPNQVRIEYVPLGELRRWPRNPKDHSLGDIHQSYDRFGYVAPMLLDERTGRLVAGHGRLDALQQRKAAGKPAPERIVTCDGQWLVPVVRGVSFESDEEAEAYGIADNRLVEAGGWNDAALAQVLADLAAGPGLNGIGFDGDDLDELLAGLAQLEPVADPGAQLSKADELQERWRVETGDVWQCGEHRICCGDCTDAAVVEKVMKGETCGLLLTDPPYGIQLDPPGHRQGYGTHPQRFTSGDRLIGDDGTLDLSFLWKFERRIVWGFPYIYDPVATGWIVWDKQPGVEGRGVTTPVEMASTTMRRGFDIVRVMWGGYYRAAGEEREPHPTQKPLAVILPFIEQWTKRDGIVFDPFLGSGTTLVACERLGRRGRGVEIHAPYISVCLERLSGMQLDCRKVAGA